MIREFMPCFSSANHYDLPMSINRYTGSLMRAYFWFQKKLLNPTTSRSGGLGDLLFFFFSFSQDNPQGFRECAVPLDPMSRPFERHG